MMSELRLMLEYIRSYEIIDWWRFELCLIAALVVGAIVYFSGLRGAPLVRACVLIFVAGTITGFVWQWRNRYNL